MSPVSRNPSLVIFSVRITVLGSGYKFWIRS
jgi:hypothetical protein